MILKIAYYIGIVHLKRRDYGKEEHATCTIILMGVFSNFNVIIFILVCFILSDCMWVATILKNNDSKPQCGTSTAYYPFLIKRAA